MEDKYIVFGGIAAVVVVVVAVGYYLEKLRTEGFKKFASGSGFQYLGNIPEDIYQAFGRLTLFNDKPSRDYRRTLLRQDGTRNFYIFDFTYQTGSGKNRKTHKHTMVAVKDEDRSFPGFFLRPENVLDKIASAVGFDDIDFPEAPTFSKKFVLKGENEAAVRSFFNPSLIKFFENAPKSTLEANQDIIVFRQTTGYCSPKKLHGLFEEARKCFEMLSSQNNASRSKFERPKEL